MPFLENSTIPFVSPNQQISAEATRRALEAEKRADLRRKFDRFEVVRKILFNHGRGMSLKRLEDIWGRDQVKEALDMASIGVGMARRAAEAAEAAESARTAGGVFQETPDDIARSDQDIKPRTFLAPGKWNNAKAVDG